MPSGMPGGHRIWGLPGCPFWTPKLDILDHFGPPDGRNWTFWTSGGHGSPRWVSGCHVKGAPRPPFCTPYSGNMGALANIHGAHCPCNGPFGWLPWIPCGPFWTIWISGWPKSPNLGFRTPKFDDLGSKNDPFWVPFGGLDYPAAGGSGGSRRRCPLGRMGPWWPLKGPTADDGSPGVPTIRMDRIMGLEMVQIWTIFGSSDRQI